MKSSTFLVSSLLLLVSLAPAAAAPEIRPAAERRDAASAPIESCERAKNLCKQRIGYGAGQGHGVTHCVIDYNHCLGRATRIEAER